MVSAERNGNRKKQIVTIRTDSIVRWRISNMGHSNYKSKKVLATLSHIETSKDELKKTAADALSIVIDAINSSIAALIITDLKGIIRFANSAFCKMFDYVLNEIKGKDSAELFSAREIDKLVDVLSIIDESESSTEEFSVKRKNGTIFVVEVSASTVTSASGERIGRMASFIDITKRKVLESNLEKKLQDALDQIKVLSGILPICASCKKIRDDKGQWHKIESYIKEHSEAVFSHGICPDCSEKLYPEFHK
jgi:PAS domain S-box-containing protein